MDVLVLGNGFDLSHNLPTTYLSFLLTTEYFTSNKKTIRLDDITIGKVFSSIQNQCVAVKNSYNAYHEVYDKYKLDLSQLTQLSTKCAENYWWNYFHSTYNKDVGWIDFEKEISIVLQLIDNFINNHNNPDRRFFIKKTGPSIAYYFPFFVEPQAPYAIIDQSGKTPIYDCEYTYDPSFVIRHAGKKTSFINKGKIVEVLFQSLNEFAEILSLYFRLFVDDTIDALVKANLLPTNEEYKKFDTVITYNYTHSFEKIYSGPKVAHIHGAVGEKIILGVNSNAEDEKKSDGAGVDLSYVDFKKYYQRVVFETDLDYLEILLEMRKADKEGRKVILSVLGHSLDDTDKDSLKELFEVSNEINIYYHNKEKVPIFVQNLIRHFGKTKFDDLRYNRKLRFIPQNELMAPEPEYIKW